MLSSMKSIVAESDNRICRLLFKMAVQLAVTMNVVAANSDIDDISLERLKGECVKEVKRLNGNFTFKDANDWQKGYYTKENDVEKEADTNSPWGDNLRASFVENCQDFCTIRLRRGRNI